MTNFLFHGEDQVGSRQFLIEQLDLARKSSQEIRSLDGSKLTARDLESTLATTNLFASETIVIENLFSRLKSKDKESCLKLIYAYSGPKQLCLWEPKEIAKTPLAKLNSSWKITLAKLPTQLFTFLDSLYPGNLSRALTLFHQLLTKSDPSLIFFMLSRQLTNLLLAQSGSHAKLAPWQLTKLRAQSARWSEAQLIHFHDELVRIDYQTKSGTTKLDLTTQLDILLVNLLG
ncbi:MAG: hypothetical protein UX38_C0011G0015 [Microgenomates group bacterium GW2011_GWC1_46_16]|uniref:DNA-directed DNA polymerase n=2 Tax=Candidatus Collieribacteriota TaxID=1752725 RepID=A0A1F5FZ29_9BACT|nr:MAG: hypothetical protein UX38_C0011G0015 [Microgenomates group bacterium GW2011_GWC1_46_16]KKU28186.1 MAG: hypothetical protein UX40_C0002G0026 [Microgenomates group bacterium GW2011_GWF2_46_18]KKU45597.1 MAG: hypothetical protein UX63_C0003G0023 [Microgenomates group bacterium GW2011_GWB1_46_7]KKU61560.1 MAG: hypothetical protein UX82_C0003G0025 [Microgenomates group bacterium GW2011_GWE1_47_12]KKU62255.1 MAG: hypothetical protein UX84_C0011G0006 [Microgenomates group bacterium GW2011_GWD1